jgi:hypothetical protein
VNLTLPFGDMHLALTLPDDLEVTVLAPLAAPPLPSLRAAISAALEGAWWSPFSRARSAAIALTEADLPYADLLPPLLARLAEVGIPPERLTLLTAPPVQLPPTLAASFRLLPHEPGAEQNIIRLGMTTRKSIISTHRAYFEANLRVALSSIRLHPALGFSGGVAGAALGLAGNDTLSSNQRLHTQSNAAPGHYEDNPARQDVEDMGRVIGVHLTLNLVCDGQGQPVGVFFGPPVDAMQEAVSLVRRLGTHHIEAPFDLVIAVPGGAGEERHALALRAAQTAAGEGRLIVVSDGQSAAAMVDAALARAPGIRRVAVLVEADRLILYRNST